MTLSDDRTIDRVPSVPPTALYKIIDACRGCAAPSGSLRSVLQMDSMPLAGLFCSGASEALAAPRLPLTWVQCGRCTLVQVAEDVDDTVLFTNYSYSSSSVPGLVRHFEEYASFLAARYGTDTPLSLLEVGCNDGVLLNRLSRAWRLVGADPSDVARNAAAGSDRYVLLNAPLDVSLIRDARLEGTLDVVTGSNCLAHSSDMRGIFAAAREALRPGGHFWLEVHDLRALLDGNQWDTIYHEHKAEWDHASLTTCLAEFGFVPVDVHHRPLHGGLLRACFEKTAGPPPRTPVGSRNASDTERSLAALEGAYERRYDSPTAIALATAVRRGERISAYGAAGRANVYLNQMKELPFSFIVDDSPLRANRFLPCIATPVVPRQQLASEETTMCLITAWNYREDIVRNNAEYTGAWLTAFPA